MLRFHGISRRDGDKHDGIHLLWSPPYPTGYCLNGFTIQRRRSEDQEQFRCFDIHPSDFQQARTQGFTDILEARIWASPTDQIAPASAPWSYRIELRESRHELRMNSPDAICAFSARADGTVIDGQRFLGTACRLTGGGIAVVWIVTNTPKSALRICGDSEAEGKWKTSDILVKGLQVPFARVNPDTPNLGTERKLATERAQPDTLQGDFGEVSRYGNAAYARAFDIPAWRVTTHDPDTERDQWDTTPLGFLLVASALDPAWRRALGFGFLDNKRLTDGARYDYRISGLVPRADRDERRFDFHTVPRGQKLPRAFRLADLTVICDRAPVVTAEEAGGDAPTALWKGIECDRISLRLPHPTTRIALAGRSDGPLDIVGIAGFLPVATLSATVRARTVLDFGAPVTEVLLKGPMFITAFIPEPLAAGLDPDEPVEVSEVLRGIAYVPTSPPDPPTDVTAENLSNAARAARRGKRDDTIGFEVTWMPPLRLDPATLPWWPPDARTAPPSDVAAYRLERTWDGRPFEPPENTKGAFVASRNADPRTEAIAPGADLLSVYPPTDESGLAETERVRAIDTFEAEQPKFGTDVTYGISCIDAIGRVSARALSPPVPLEKRIRPPAPIGPTKSEAAPEKDALVVPSGVQARLLQGSDPDLTIAERALVDSRGDVVVLKWGWGPVQRKLDTLVKEFRIYETGGKLAEITATINAPPVAVPAGGWRLSCSFSRPVTPNEFTGTKVALGLAYEIAAHGTVSVDLHPAVIDPSRSPVGSVMTFIRTDGSEEDPESWDSRVQVVPRGSTPADPKEVESYELILPASWISVSPSHRRQIRSFGISAADRESYVVDRRLAVEFFTAQRKREPRLTGRGDRALPWAPIAQHRRSGSGQCDHAGTRGGHWCAARFRAGQLSALRRVTVDTNARRAGAR